jgi:hypothetical protein
MKTEYTRAQLLQAHFEISRIQDEIAGLQKQLSFWLDARDDIEKVVGYLDTEAKQCLQCGWSGDLSDCKSDRQWTSHAGGGYISVPLCPVCGSEHLAIYESNEAKEARLQFTGAE